jgi:FdhD protein
MKEIGKRSVVPWKGSFGAAREDEVAIEEPLEIRIAGDSIAITMRTPGDDHDLVLGFLFAEGIVGSLDDIGSIAHCGRPGDEGFGNAIDVIPAPGTVLDPERSRRGTLTTSACGVCGRQSIDDLLSRIAPVPPGERVDPASLERAMVALRGTQTSFARTGGLHAAALFDSEGLLLANAEDVGRHNAVDKVVGRLVRVQAKASLLVVSGRVSFEIVQKAAVARVGAVAGISAPTSLAIDLAERAGIGLAGFVRDGRANVYSSSARFGA